MIYMNLAGVGLRGTHADVLQVAIDSQGRSTTSGPPLAANRLPRPQGAYRSQSHRARSPHAWTPSINVETQMEKPPVCYPTGLCHPTPYKE